MTDEKGKDMKSLGPVGRKFIEFASAKMSGQDKAIRRIAKALDQHASGLKVDDKPIYISLMVGGPGSGKTLLAGLLAEFWFGSPDALTTVSCSSFFQNPLSQWDLNQYDYRYTRALSKPMQKMLDGHHEIAQARIEAAQKLGQAKAEGADENVLKALEAEFNELEKKFQESHEKYQPIVNTLRSVVVFDHIEEAKSNVQDELSRIFEKGLHIRETEDGPVAVSFRNAFIFITCNDCVHPEDEKKESKLGFNAGVSSKNRGNDSRRYLKSIEEIKNYMSPRLLSLLDRVEIFQAYEKSQLLNILEILIKDFNTELGKKFPIKLSIGDDVKNFIVHDSSDHPEHGIRLLKRKFDKYIRGQLASIKCQGKLKPGDSVSVRMEKVDGADFVKFSLQNE